MKKDDECSSDKRCIEKIFYYNENSPPFVFTGLGDLHVGNICSSERAINSAISEIAKTPNAYWFGMGDFADSIVLQDPRFKLGIVDIIERKKINKEEVDALRNDYLDYQFEKMLNYLMQIKDKCISVVTGNHEEELLKRCGTNLAKRLARKIGVPYLGYEGFVTLKFKYNGKKKNYTDSKLVFFITHGYGGGRKAGAKVNRLEDLFIHYPADVILFAHGHEMLTKASLALVPGDTNFKHKHRIAQMCGSFLLKHDHSGNNTTTYVEKKGLPPVAIGKNDIIYDPKEPKRMRWSGWVMDY